LSTNNPLAVALTQLLVIGAARGDNVAYLALIQALGMVYQRASFEGRSTLAGKHGVNVSIPRVVYTPGYDFLLYLENTPL
jgi:hypothetical protein